MGLLKLVTHLSKAPKLIQSAILDLTRQPRIEVNQPIENTRGCVLKREKLYSKAWRVDTKRIKINSELKINTTTFQIW